MKKKKTILIIFIVIIFLLSIVGVYLYLDHQEYLKEQAILEQEKKEKKLLNNINSHYNDSVITNKEATIYELTNNKYKEAGKIAKDIELSLYDEKINIETKYFKINDLNYYIRYEDVDKIDSLKEKDKRYKKYLPFNENIISNDVTNFYKDGKLSFTINKSYNLPIIIKDTDKYYVEFYNELLYVLKDDVKEVITNQNTDKKSRADIAVLTYHAIYDPKVEKCETEICHTIQQFDSHIKYFADNNYLSLNMKELDYFLDGKLRIPTNSVSITIDDGFLGVRSIPILEKHKVNATMFLVTSWFNPEQFKSDYLELHSHGHNLHKQGVCPGGQGGGIKCLPKDTLLKDLKDSREELNNTNVFCYPFYEYNDYAISILKEAGFKMAFIGGYYKARIGVNKLLIPRYTVIYNDDVEYIKTLIK